jgi:hypothetical protein
VGGSGGWQVGGAWCSAKAADSGCQWHPCFGGPCRLKLAGHKRRPPPGEARGSPRGHEQHVRAGGDAVGHLGGEPHPAARLRAAFSVCRRRGVRVRAGAPSSVTQRVLIVHMDVSSALSPQLSVTLPLCPLRCLPAAPPSQDSTSSAKHPAPPQHPEPPNTTTTQYPPNTPPQTPPRPTLSLYCASMARRSFSRSSRPLPSITSWGVGLGFDSGFKYWVSSLAWFQFRSLALQGTNSHGRSCTGAGANCNSRSRRRGDTKSAGAAAAAQAQGRGRGRRGAAILPPPHLRALPHDPARAVPDQVDALLVVQPPDEAQQGGVGVLWQAQLALEGELRGLGRFCGGYGRFLEVTGRWGLLRTFWSALRGFREVWGRC